ncbi:T9SS type A sorting domain-containing protein, partial [bacterium]|nr:T9SS type A sorting domain-containing protein [bacterium]
ISYSFGETNTIDFRNLYSNFRELTRYAAHPVDFEGGATYLSAMTLYQSGPASGYVPLMISAKKPGGDDDTTYSGNVIFNIIEEYPNSSAGMYIYTGTGVIPTDEAALDGGGGFLFIMNTEPEWTLVQVIAVDGSLKASFPAPIEFVETGTEATRLMIKGYERGHSVDQFRIFQVQVVDDEGKIVPNYGTDSLSSPILMDMVSVSILGETVPDNSALLSSFFTPGMADSISIPLFSGVGLFSIMDSEIETVTFQAHSTPPDSTLLLTHSEPSTYEFVDFTVGTDLLILSFGGISANAGYTQSLMALCFAGTGIDVTNSTSQANLNVIDITGTASATITPDDWLTLSGGMASFALDNPEPDSFGIIVTAETRGEPFLGTPFYYTVYFYPPGVATHLDMIAPLIGIVEDSVEIEIIAVDDANNFDSLYTGYVSIEISEDSPDESFSLFDPRTGAEWTASDTHFVKLVNGSAIIYGSNTVSENVQLSAIGVDRILMFDQGELANSHETDIYFETGGTSPANKLEFIIPGDRFFLIDYWYAFNVVAIDTVTGDIDIAFMDTVTLSVDGDATLEPEDGRLFLNHGLGTFRIMDMTSEVVTISVEGGGLPGNEEHISFMDPDSGGQIFILIYEPPTIFPNEEFEIPFAILNPYGELNTSWNGYITMEIEEANPNHSFSYPHDGNPDSIEITNGMGSIYIMDSEPESFIIDVSGPEPLLPWHSSGLIYGGLIASFHDTVCASDSTFSSKSFRSYFVLDQDTIWLYVVDSDTNTVDYTTSVNLIALEELDDSSLIILPSPTIEISGGIGYAVVSDPIGYTSVENVDFYLCSSDSLLLFNYGESITDSFFIGSILFFYTSGIEYYHPNLPLSTKLTKNYPNPFNSVSFLEFTVSEPADVTIEVYNIFGQKLNTIFDNSLTPGYYKAFWNGKNDNNTEQPSGIYFYKFKAKNKIEIRKTLLLK